jgi:hypothetical protein
MLVLTTGIYAGEFTMSGNHVRLKGVFPFMQLTGLLVCSQLPALIGGVTVTVVVGSYSTQVTATHISWATDNLLPKFSSGNLVDSSVTDTGGGIARTETAAPPRAANIDKLYTDSTTHRWKMNNNRHPPSAKSINIRYFHPFRDSYSQHNNV